MFVVECCRWCCCFATQLCVCVDPSAIYRFCAAVDALLSVSKKFLAHIKDLGPAPVREAVERSMPYLFDCAWR
jgi:hypothetical protein